VARQIFAEEFARHPGGRAAGNREF
jgi:hypothetical protein